MTKIVDVLSTHASRWVEVTLNLPRSVLPYWIHSTAVCHYSTLHLQSAEDEDPEVGDEEEYYPITLGFQIAPRLTKVTLKYDMIEGIDLPLHQLLYLKLEWYLEDGPGMALDRLHYLTQCPDLVELRVVHTAGDWHLRGRGERAYPPIVNKAIRVLHVLDVDFIKSLSLPALQELYIDMTAESFDCPHPGAIASGILRLLRQLRHLLKSSKLLDCMTYMEHILNALCATPQLEHLELEYTDQWQNDCDTWPHSTTLLPRYYSGCHSEPSDSIDTCSRFGEPWS